MRTKSILIMLIVVPLLLGCAITQPIRPQEALIHPLGTDSLKIGMTKEQVKVLLGEPDTITPVERSKDILGTEREEWIYHGRYSDLPVNADYFGKTLYLIFEGNNLTSYKGSK